MVVGGRRRDSPGLTGLESAGGATQVQARYRF